MWQEPGVWGQRGQSQGVCPDSTVSAQNSRLWCGLHLCQRQENTARLVPRGLFLAKPCLLARWEVMSRCAQEPALLGPLTVAGGSEPDASPAWTRTSVGRASVLGLLLPIPRPSVSTVEAALGACVAPAGRWEVGQRGQASWGLRTLL